MLDGPVWRSRTLAWAPSKDELIVAEPACHGREFEQLETALPAEIEYFLGFRDLERVTANPVQGVVPAAHPAVVTPVPPLEVAADMAAENRPAQRPKLRGEHDDGGVG